MSELRVLVADDEAPARRVLSRLLRAHDDVRVVAECADGLGAVERIRAERPQLVFLDVKMPELDGFEVIELIGVEAMPPVVFVTAFDAFATRAFEVHALDYLVKPFSDARFEFTLARARRRLAEMDAPRLAAELRALLDARPRAPGGPASLARFLVKLGNRTSVIAAAEVDWIEAQDYYVTLHAGGACHLHRQTIRSLERELDPLAFVRIERSAIVNLARVREVHRRRDGRWTVLLADGTELPVSRRRRELLLLRLGGERASQGSSRTHPE
ncbi:MAG TPA: LytTR family DNA-binding domain-containing protein [Myxococcales bacterium]|nr:LytTR family DNA-binding domain-containing protein [Myxococcales bacterium]